MLLLPALALALLQTVVAAPSVDQLRLAFPTSSDQLKGSSQALPDFDFTVISNSSHALYVVNATSTAPTAVGWIGVGHGTAMSNADFLITWPTINSTAFSWTLSHRSPNKAFAQSEGQPSVASTDAATSTATFYTLVPELTTSDRTSPYSSVAWIRALDPGASYPAPAGVTPLLLTTGPASFVYASATAFANPGDPSEGARLQQHDNAHAATSLDLSTAVAVGAAAASGDGTAAVPTTKAPGRSKRDMMLITHATLGSLALLIFTPAALLVARFGRDRFRWFPSHSALNALAVVLIIATFAIGTYQTGNEFSSSKGGDLHHRLGLVLLLLFLIQPILGFISHRYSSASPLTSSHPSLRLRPRVSPFRILHILLGLATVALGFVQLANGYYTEWPQKSDAQTDVPRAVKGIFWALVAAETAAYVAAWVVGAVTKGREGETGSPAEAKMLKGAEKGRVSHEEMGRASSVA